jgi:pyruvate/2-oxoglutarate dehydrogenase complex dihydrolipoamide acyltransferase (E2) component
MSKQENYSIGKWPKNRDIIVDAVTMSRYYNHVVGFIDADATEIVRVFNKYSKKTGDRLSLTAYIMRCMALTAKEVPETRTFRKGRRKTIVFNDIDIKCMIEREIDGKRIPLHYMFKKADKKSFKEIHEELRYVQQKKQDKSKKYRKQKRTQKFLMNLPKFIRHFMWHIIMTRPLKTVKNLGVLGVTSVNKFSLGLTGVVLPKTMHQTHCLIGTIYKKPTVVDDKVVIRDFVSLTLQFNHDIVDGGPAVDFARTLAEKIAAGVELEEFDV